MAINRDNMAIWLAWLEKFPEELHLRGLSMKRRKDGNRACCAMGVLFHFCRIWDPWLVFSDRPSRIGATRQDHNEVAALYNWVVAMNDMEGLTFREIAARIRERFDIEKEEEM